MKITGVILNNLNEDVDFTNLGNALDFLIRDEVEAIEGYQNVLNKVKPNMSESQYKSLEENLNHIISEEREHIKELQQLKDIFLV